MMRDPRVYLPLVILALGLAGFAVLLATGPRAEQRPTEAPVPLVRVVEVVLRDVQLKVTTHGTVAPRTESDLVPEVSGPVVWVSASLVSGGFFDAGEPLLRIDPRDYEVALERARASVARAKSEHDRASRELERRQGLAKRDFASASQLDTAVNAESVAAASLREARAVRAQAQRDLERTEIRAPFAGRVREERVAVGQFVNRGAPIAKLYAVDYAEVRLPIPDEELAYLDLPLFHRGETEPESGPGVLLRARFAGGEHAWEGRVVRTEGEIDPRSRMVNVIARIEDPYGASGDRERPPLAVGLFVEADILGNRVEDVAVLPRAALRGRDRVWVVDGESRLRFRTVEPLRSTRTEVVIRSGLEGGERICISPLETAVDGMRVRVVDEGGGPGERLGVEGVRS
jgi:RND family efflux transporter MFP subunit